MVNKALVIAHGVHETGRREILGVDVGEAETEAFWTEFLRDLVKRGLAGVQLAISDAHAGLKAAIAKVLGCAWQRCTVHFLRDCLGHARRDQHGLLGALIRPILFRLAPDDWTYRAVRHRWTGRPPWRPAVAARRRDSRTVDVWASWNGATEIRRRRVLAGSSPEGFDPTGDTVRFADLETRTRVRTSKSFVAVQALGSTGRVLRQSPAVRVQTTVRSRSRIGSRVTR